MYDDHTDLWLGCRIKKYKKKEKSPTICKSVVIWVSTAMTIMYGLDLFPFKSSLIAVTKNIVHFKKKRLLQPNKYCL